MGAIPKNNYNNNFPIGEEVPGCVLSEFKYFSNGTDKGVIVSFKNNNKVLVSTIKLPKKANFEYLKEYNNEANRVKSWVESILYAYLDGNEMAEIIRDCSNSFESYVGMANKALLEKRAFSTPVLLKTLLNRSKEVVLPRYPFFVKKEGDTRIKLSYTPYEKQQLLSNK